MIILVSVVKIIVAALIIAFASWLSKINPELAGFIIALPILSLLALAFSHLEHHNSQTSINFAKSIMIGVPVSYLFFIPFFFAEKFNYNFWVSYIIGGILLVAGFFLHRYLMGFIN